MHEPKEDLLLAYLTNALPDDERLALETHLTSCRQCRDALDEWRSIAGAARERAARIALTLPPLRQPARHMPQLQTAFTDNHKGVNAMHPTRTLPQPRRNTRRLAHNLPLTLAAALVAALLLTITLLVRFIAPQPALISTQAQPTNTVYDVLLREARFHLFAALVERTPLAHDVLRGEEAITLFVLPDEVLEPLMPLFDRDLNLSQQLVWSHLLAGRWSSAQLGELSSPIGSTWEVEGQQIRTSILPRLEQEVLYIFHPDSAASARVIEADIAADNGVLHVLDAPLLALELPERIRRFADAHTLYATIQAHPELSVFAEGLRRSSWVSDVLQHSSSLTVFVPTDEAFSSLLGDLTVAELPADELEGLLIAHMVEGLWSAQLLVELGAVSTEWPHGSLRYTTHIRANAAAIPPQGSPVLPSPVTINGRANLLAANIITSNGVLHIMDAALVTEINGN